MQNPEQKPLVTLDIGHSSVKSVYSLGQDIHRMFMPSLVCPATPILDEVEAKRARRETVTYRGGKYFVGETALIHGSTQLSGLSENWISTKEHSVLMCGAVQKIGEVVDTSAGFDLVMGLPTNLYQTQKDTLEELARQALPGIESFKVIPQSLAPFFGLMLDCFGIPSDRDPSESWAVIEVGYFSTDFMRTKQGRWSQTGSDMCHGVRLAIETFRKTMSDKGVSMSLQEADEALRSGFVKSFGKKMDVSAEAAEAISLLTSEVFDAAKRLMEEHVRQLDGVLIAGGGAPLVFETIHKQWPHAVICEDSRFAVAEGMHRSGLARKKLKQAKG
jgi:plasmid segregation protein ParM